jgi:hypothetical protein
MDADFPAAHSMDTYWFAVDKDGRVGHFTSGSAGAVPVTALSGLAAEEAEEQLAQALPRGEALYDWRGRQPPCDRPGVGKHNGTDFGPLASVMMFLKSLDLVTKEIADGSAVPFRSVTDFAVWFRELDAELARRLHRNQVCLSCFREFDALMGGEGGGFGRMCRRGAFIYWHIGDDAFSGPYGRVRVPECPLHIDEFPPLLRTQLKATRFPVSFADAIYVQPIRHARCDSWRVSWLDIDGKTIRAIPGREQQHAHDLQEWLGSGKFVAGEPIDTER